jgi:hypothetical protein
MKPDQLPDLSLTHLFLSDPVLVIGSLLPILVLVSLLYYRLRAYRRITALAARNEQRYDLTSQQNVAHWQEAAARSERMIVLLTEIRDHLASMAQSENAPRSTTQDSDPAQ